MAQVIRASEMGFCMGVRRAVQMMEHAATPESPISSAGEIVHNPHVVEQLERAGVRQLPGPDDVDGDFGAITAERVGPGRVAITAHGVGEQVLIDLERAGLDIVDTTCPVVTRAQRYAHKFVREGWHALIFGDPGHKEVRGITGWGFDAKGRSKVSVIEHADVDHLRDVIETFPGGFPNKIGVMAQTQTPSIMLRAYDPCSAPSSPTSRRSSGHSSARRSSRTTGRRTGWGWRLEIPTRSARRRTRRSWTCPNPRCSRGVTPTRMPHRRSRLASSPSSQRLTATRAARQPCIRGSHASSTSSETERTCGMPSMTTSTPSAGRDPRQRTTHNTKTLSPS